MVQLCKLGLTSCPAAFNAVKVNEESTESGETSKDDATQTQDATTQTQAESTATQIWKFVDNVMKMSEVNPIRVIIIIYHTMIEYHFYPRHVLWFFIVQNRLIHCFV